MIAHAQAEQVAFSFVQRVNEVIVFPLIILLTTIALLVFLWGGFQFVVNAGNEAGRQKGRSQMLWGIIGLLVMLSAYAILTIATNTIGVDVDQYSRGL
jgi:phosphotransferase system  glucose/maltose/N-acetylglucosamine-specific IIC component